MRTDTGVRLDAGTAQEARDHRMTRGPSRISQSTEALERIRTVVVEEHDDIARLVASRIATLIREKEAGGDQAVLGLPDRLPSGCIASHRMHTMKACRSRMS